MEKKKKNLKENTEGVRCIYFTEARLRSYMISVCKHLLRIENIVKKKSRRESIMRAHLLRSWIQTSSGKSKRNVCVFNAAGRQIKLRTLQLFILISWPFPCKIGRLSEDIISQKYKLFGCYICNLKFIMVCHNTEGLNKWSLSGIQLYMFWENRYDFLQQRFSLFTKTFYFKIKSSLKTSLCSVNKMGA